MMLNVQEFSENNIQIREDKRSAIRTLEEGLARGCADDITEVLINLEDGTCDYVELIPILERIAREDWFCYFDDNGAGGLPRPDVNRRTSFSASAFRAIDNIEENARLESDSEFAGALKSNNAHLINDALERLRAQGVCADQSLLPILEKLVRKDVYQTYSYYSGVKTDRHLRKLAQEVIQMIDPSAQNPETCSLCSSLPDDLTINTGRLDREEYFPGVFNKLIGMDSEYDAELRRCPYCATYFNWIDMSSWTGSGNSDYERLVRLSTSVSQLLDRLFSSDVKDHPEPNDVGEYLETVPLNLLLRALRKRLYSAPEIVAPFVPHLVRLLAKNNDTSLWEFLNSYARNKPERAEDIREAFRTWEE